MIVAQAKLNTTMLVFLAVSSTGVFTLGQKQINHVKKKVKID